MINEKFFELLVGGRGREGGGGRRGEEGGMEGRNKRNEGNI